MSIAEAMEPTIQTQLVEHLRSFVTPHKNNLFDKIIKHRTKHLTVVLENIYQPQNASAVVRTCDCFGIQDLHIIENSNEYQLNADVTLGSNKWVSMHYHNTKPENTSDCLHLLKKQGYQVIATTPHEKDCLLDDLDIGKKTALVFGQEMRGLSEEALALADGYVKIPQYGFTESFNISVSAAICMHYLTQKMKKSEIQWQLSDYEKTEVLHQWCRNTIKNPNAYEKEFLDSLQS